MRFTVSPVAPDELTAACRLLAAHRPAADRDAYALRFRDLFVTGEFDPAGLLAARDGSGVPRGAVLVQALPGALGLAWPPRVEPGCDRVAAEDALLAAGCDWLRARGVRVCQSFAPEAESDWAAPLERYGFRHVTRVAHMRREVGPADAAVEAPGLQLAPYAADPAGFADTLLRTYDGSLDCPELTGDRTAVELVEGFRGSGLLGGRWWFAVGHEGRTVGVVMWEPGTEPGLMELSYLGLVPAARGRGLGDALVRRSVAFARDGGFRALHLSVDVRNEPALRLYDRHGFRTYDRRDVYLAAWPR